MLFFYSTTGVVVGCIEREVSRSEGIEDGAKLLRLILLGFSSLLTLLLLIGILLRYRIEFKLKKYKGEITKVDDLFTTSRWKNLLLELILYSIHPNPLMWNWTFHEKDVNFGFDAVHKYNDVLLAIMMLSRVYFMLRFFMSLSFFMSS